MTATELIDTPNFQLYHADCRLILPTLGEVDHCFTDPPYHAITHGGAKTSKKREGSTKLSSKLLTFDSMTQDELSEAFNLIGVRTSQWFISFVDYNHVLQMQVCPPHDMEFVRFGIWDKPNYTPQFTGDRPAQGWEAIAILHKAKKRKKWHGGGTRAVWRCTKVQDSAHPTAKPLELVERLIRLFTDAGDTILDPFMGSGTTGVACMRTGRKFIGIEMDAKYYAIAEKRIKDAAAQGCLFADTLKPKATKEQGFDF